jgi:hypothetical protein
MKRTTREVAAKKAAKHPRVRSEITRLTMEMLPKVEDMRRAYDHALAVILRLTVESPDDRLRFDAARWIRTECEKNGRLAAEIVTESRARVARESPEQIIAELRAIYAKALGPQPAGEPLTLEVAVEGVAPEANCVSAESPDVLADASGAEKLASYDSAESEGRPEADESGPLFRRVAVPGTFPPKFRRVRVR